MVILKNKGIRYSEYVIDAVNSRFADETKIDASYETFYNCREMGYVLRIHDKDYKEHMCIWIYAQRNSDEPTITWDYIVLPKKDANMFDEESYRERTKTFKDVDEASQFVIDLVKQYFEV